MSFTRRQILGGLTGLVAIGLGAGGAARYWLGRPDPNAGQDYVLIAAPLDVELVPGHKTEAWAFGPSAPGTELRVRLLNLDNTLTYRINLKGNFEAKVYALDGNPIAPRPLGKDYWLGPGMRICLAIKMPPVSYTHLTLPTKA